MNFTRHISCLRTLLITFSLFVIPLVIADPVRINSISKNGFDLSNASVDPKKILSGGPERDGIPSIDKPNFVSANTANHISNRDYVIGVYYRGVAKAYPIRIMNWHEIVNDTFKQKSVVVTYCPLCGTGIAFRTDKTSGVNNFGVSGLLYNNDLLLYDRNTHSLWSQVLGTAISGPLKGSKLQAIASDNTTWADWKKRYPGTLVLSNKTGVKRDYSRSPYKGYAQSNRVFYPLNHMDKRYHPKERVIGLTINGQHKVYPFKELAKLPSPIADSFAGKRLKIKFNHKTRSAQVYDDDTNQRIVSTGAYWFAWMSFHPNSLVYRAKRR